MKGRLETELKVEKTMMNTLKTMSPWLTEYYYNMQSGMENSSATTYMRHTIKYLNWLKSEMNVDISDPDNMNIKAKTYASAYMSSLKVSTRNKEKATSFSLRSLAWTALNKMYLYLVDNGHVQKNPMSTLNRDNPAKDFVDKDALTTDEIKQLFKNISQNKNVFKRTRDLALVSLLIDTATRIGGVLELNTEDIDFEKKQVVITSKGHNTYRHNLSDVTMNYMSRWLEERECAAAITNTSALFIGTTGKRMGYACANKLFSQKYTEGIDKHMTPHTTRRTMATLLYEETHDIELVKDKLQHHSSATTSRYLDKGNEHIERANVIGRNLLESVEK